MKSSTISASAFCVLLCCVIDIRADDLVTNGDFSQGNTGFATQYTFIPTGYSTQPTTYAVRTASTDFNSALDSFADHTTGNGLMMVVDGGSAQEIVWTQTITVQPNTEDRKSVV